MGVGMTLIVGASGGIGRATAEKLAAAGESLYLHYYTGERPVRMLREKLSADYPDQRFFTVHADLADPGGADALLNQLNDPVDRIVYLCGKSDIGLFQDVSLRDLADSVQLHLVSMFRLIQKLIEPMIRKKKGKIVVVTSIWGLTGASTEVLYSMVKGGQAAFVKALAKEVAPSGISVNGVAPGAVDTPMMHMFSPSDIKQVEEEIPMGRLARPEEVAALIAFLLSSDSDYINGQVVSVNGAWYC